MAIESVTTGSIGVPDLDCTIIRAIKGLSEKVPRKSFQSVGFEIDICAEQKDNFCKWWKASEKSKEPEKHSKIGKPNVSRRKSIYSLNPDGSSNERHLVNAQNYAVLVTDVPDIVKGKRR